MIKTFVTDPWLGRREVGDDPVDIIQDQLKLLLAMKNDGRVPTSSLLYDIEVYKFILNSENPEKFSEDYFQERAALAGQRKTNDIKKWEVAKRLGWKIPRGEV